MSEHWNVTLAENPTDEALRSALREHGLEGEDLEKVFTDMRRIEQGLEPLHLTKCSDGASEFRRPRQ